LIYIYFIYIFIFSVVIFLVFCGETMPVLLIVCVL